MSDGKIFAPRPPPPPTGALPGAVVARTSESRATGTAQRAAVQAAPAPASAPLGADAATCEQLRIYYADYYPIDELLALWSPPVRVPRTDVSDMEFCLRLAGADGEQIMWRKLSIAGRREFVALAERLCRSGRPPVAIDTGAVYAALPDFSVVNKPMSHEEFRRYVNDEQTTPRVDITQLPVAKLFQLEVDIDAYAHRTCGCEKGYCARCWYILVAALRVLERWATTHVADYRAGHAVCSLSGRKGVHFSVAAPSLCAGGYGGDTLDVRVRAAVASLGAFSRLFGSMAALVNSPALGVYSGTAGQPPRPCFTDADYMQRFRFVRDCLAMLEPLFVSHVLVRNRALSAALGVEAAAAVRAIAPGGGPVAAVALDALDQLSRAIGEIGGSGGGVVDVVSPVQRGRLAWTAFRTRIAAVSAADDMRWTLRRLPDAMVLWALYPRIDVGAAASLKHLMKTICSPHPSAGTVAVTIPSGAELHPDQPLFAPPLWRLLREQTGAEFRALHGARIAKAASLHGVLAEENAERARAKDGRPRPVFERGLYWDRALDRQPRRLVE